MPNISGIVNGRKNIANPDEILSRFRNVHSLNGFNFIHRSFKSNHCVINNTLTGIINTNIDQPVIDPTNNVTLFLEGEIYNANELLSNLNCKRNLSHCDILLVLFLKYGNDFVSFLNGEYNIVIYHKESRQLSIFNDHLSSKPLYYMEKGGNLFFGSEKKSILSITTKHSAIDPVGILQLFVHGYNLNERTLIKGLKRLPPASFLNYKNENLTIKRYPLMRFNLSKSQQKEEELVEQWCDELKRATFRRLKGKKRVLLNLSGGYDSRILACAIPRSFRPLSARTRGHIKSQEVIYATEIAKRLNFEHFREEPNEVSPSEFLNKIVWRTECESNFINCLSIMGHPVMKRQADFQIGGVLGGIIKGYNYPYLFLPYKRRDFIDMIFGLHLNKCKSVLDDIFNREFLSKHIDDLKDAFLCSFDTFNSDTNKQLYEIWSLYEYQIRGQLSTGAVDNYQFEHIRPLLDKDHLSFVLKLSNRLRFGQVLYQAVIYKLGPEIRDIPVVNTNLRVRNSVLKNNFNTLITLGKKSYLKTLRKFGKNSRFEYKPAGNPNRTLLVKNDIKLKQIIEGFVKSNSFDDSILNRKGIINFLDKFYQGKIDYPQTVCLLATLASGIPYFITKNPTICPIEAEPLSGN